MLGLLKNGNTVNFWIKNVNTTVKLIGKQKLGLFQGSKGGGSGVV